MWLLISSGGSKSLFHLAGGATEYITNHTQEGAYTLEFVPIWELPQIKSPLKEHEDRIQVQKERIGFPEFPVPLSREK